MGKWSPSGLYDENWISLSYHFVRLRLLCENVLSPPGNCSCSISLPLWIIRLLALYNTTAHNNKFMHAFVSFFFLVWRPTQSVHDKHANWTIIKPSTEKNINSHIVLSHPMSKHGSLLLWRRWKKIFNFAIRNAQHSRALQKRGECGMEKAYTWSQITSENVNQYWLIFDCFPRLLLAPLVDQLKVEEDSSFCTEQNSRLTWFERDDFHSRNAFRMCLFMCFGDVQQMICFRVDCWKGKSLDPWLTDKDTAMSSLERRKFKPKFPFEWIELSRLETTNGTLRVWGGKLAKCTRVEGLFCEMYPLAASIPCRW